MKVKIIKEIKPNGDVFFSAEDEGGFFIPWSSVYRGKDMTDEDCIFKVEKIAESTKFKKSKEIVKEIEI